MDHKKIVYTSGEGGFPQKMSFFFKKCKNGPRKIVHTSGEGLFLQNVKNGPQKNSIHFSDIFPNIFQTFFTCFLSFYLHPLQKMQFFVFNVEKMHKNCKEK